MLLGSFVAALPVSAAPVRQAAAEIGPVTTVGLDAQGNGWAVANVAGVGTAAFLLRIEDGTWRMAADRTSRPDLLFEDVGMSKMVLVADGSSGWAIGTDVALQEPVLWRLQNGRWSRVAANLPSNARFISGLAMSEDGKTGWLSVHNPAHAAEYLRRLQNGAWTDVKLPEDTGIEFISLSPNGRYGWATGELNGDPKIFGLSNGQWSFIPGAFLPPDSYLSSVATDNDGNGWAVAVQQQPSARISLIRLRQDSPPGTALEITPPPALAADPETYVVAPNVVLDRLGRGWFGGDFQTVKTATPNLVYNLAGVLARLDGDNATQVDGATAGALAADVAPHGLSVSYDGGHAWVGTVTEPLGGTLVELREPWLHEKPAGAGALPGPAICFREVQYCLRGTFARYWQQNGGLDRFGYPISSEVIENIGGKDYRVQYTQRARFEDHPENKGTSYEVLLGLLGNTLADARADDDPFQPKDLQVCSGCRWFPETGHNLALPFLAYWLDNGALPVFGLPRSEAFAEKSVTDGKTYTVQYFERNRIEYHPENKGTKYEFLLGLLGVEQFKNNFGYTP